MFLARLPGDASIALNTNLRSPGGYIFPNSVLKISVNLGADETLQLPSMSATAASTISGRVIDGDGIGIAGVEVTFITVITDAAGGPQFLATIDAVRTDGNGEYRRDMLGPGDYQIKATIDRPNAATLTVYYPATTDARTAARVVLGEGSETTADIEIPKTIEGTFKISGHVRWKTVP